LKNSHGHAATIVWVCLDPQAAQAIFASKASLVMDMKMIIRWLSRQAWAWAIAYRDLQRNHKTGDSHAAQHRQPDDRPQPRSTRKVRP